MLEVITLEVIPIVILALCLLILSVSQLNYTRWRTRDAKESHVHLSDRVLDRLETTSDKVGDSNEKMGDLQSQVNSIGHEVAERDEKIEEHLKTLAGIAEERGLELQQYKDGYNLSINRNIIMGIIDALDSIQSYLAEPSLRSEEHNSLGYEYLSATRDRLENVLDGQDIEEFFPQSDSYVNDLGPDVRVRETIPTHSDEDVGKIVNVLFPGYRMQITGDVSKVIRPALVSVYSKEKE